MVIQFNDLIPVYLIDYAAAIIVAAILLGLVYKFRQWFLTVPTGLFHEASRKVGGSRLVSLFFSELANSVLLQRKVINDSKSRWATHFLVFWGFLGLGFATVWDDVFFHEGALPAPFSLDNFGNIVGNIAGLMAITGLTVMLGRYLFVSKFKNSKGDMFFFLTLYVAIITGFITEFSRYSGASIPTYTAYVVHLAIVGALLISAPFTHFFHSILTPLMRYIERTRSALQPKEGLNYAGDRYAAMTEISERVKSGDKPPTKPNWLKEEESKDKA